MLDAAFLRFLFYYIDYIVFFRFFQQELETGNELVATKCMMVRKQYFELRHSISAARKTLEVFISSDQRRLEQTAVPNI